MFWIALAVVSAATLLIKFGALSVLVGIQALALKGALVVLILMASVLLWIKR